MNALQKKLENLSEEDLQAVYHNCFDSEAGQLVLEDLKNRCFFKTPTATGAWDRPGEIYYNEGMRSVVLHVETMLTETQKQESESNV